jgi:predicted RNase H-like HicB family nuclease
MISQVADGMEFGYTFSTGHTPKHISRRSMSLSFMLSPMKFKVALHRSEEGYSVSVPGLPGCWSQGETEEEALANIEDAIREYLAAAADLLQDADLVREVEVAV